MQIESLNCVPGELGGEGSPHALKGVPNYGANKGEQSNVDTNAIGEARWVPLRRQRK